MPKNITIPTKNIPEILLEEINASDNKSRTLQSLLDELIKLRYTDSQEELAFREDDINELEGRVDALRLDLEGGRREIENYKIANAELSRRVKVAEESLRTLDEHVDMKIKLFQAQQTESRKALNHAISLVSYLGKVGHDD